MSETGKLGGMVDDAPVIQGAITGVAAFVVGFVLTAILAGIGTRNEETAVPAVHGIGWFFYESHFADVVHATSDASFNLFVNTAMPQFVHALVPVVVLIGAGFTLTWRYTDGTELTDGVGTGPILVVGYFPLAVLGTFVFSYESWAPDLVTATVFAGLAFPIALGAVGGIVAIGVRQTFEE